MKLANILLFILLSSVQNIHSVTIVYNMKVRRIFSDPKSLQPATKRRWVATVLPYFYARKRHIFEQSPTQIVNIRDKTLSGGVLFDLRYISPKHWWIELTTGLEKESLKSRGTSNFNISRVGFDDIIINPGYNFYPTKKSQMSIYALAGFPTRTRVTPNETFDTLVGTRFFGLGTGLEFAYDFIKTRERAFIGIAQFRLVHFFNRRFFPVLPRNAKIQPGNETDFLLTLLYVTNHSDVFDAYEFGYNPTIFTNQAVILPTQTIKTNTFLRNSFYFSYKHLGHFKLFNKPTVVGGGFSYARTKLFDAKIFACWLNLSVVF